MILTRTASRPDKPSAFPPSIRLEMRSSQSPPTLLSLLGLLLSSCHHTTAKPYPRDSSLAGAEGISFLQERSCAYPCGWSGQLCCTSSQQCYTDASGQAQCGAGSGGGNNAVAQGSSAQAGAGQWQYFTTTWVETDLVTRVETYSSFLGAATSQVSVADFIPTSTWAPAATTQLQCGIPCGTLCCASGQYCAMAGQCAAEVVGGFSSSYYNSYTSSQTYSAPLRPTSGTATTTTSTAGGVTATVPFQTPVGTAGNIVYSTGAAASNKGLSGGAIAGIVIGVIAGIILLLLLCAALCFGAGRSILGGRRTRREETTVIERHHRQTGGGGGGRTWYGGQASRPDPRAKRSGAFGGFGPVLAGLGTLALALGVKRRFDRRKETSSSYGSGSSYYSDEYTSESE